MKVIDNTAVRLYVSKQLVPAVKSQIPKSEVLQEYGTHCDMLVYWGHDEIQRLTRLLDNGEKAAVPPSPIFRDYDWPGIYKPFNHQKETAAYLSLRQRAFCFNEAGTGKTSAAIWAADYLMKLGKVRRVLIICPLSIMYSAWQADIFNTAMHRSAAVAYGSSDKRTKIINGAYEFVITNFDGVQVAQDAIRNARFDLIIVDECFVAGTLVATPMGRRPIEQLEAGDKVLTSDGVMRIKRLVRNTAKQLVEVKLGNGQTIKCTPEHPFFTDVGWVCAKNLAGRRLVSGIELSCLRAGISPIAASSVVGYSEQQTNWSDLFKILRTEEVALSEPQQEYLQQLVARATGQTIGTEVRSTQGETVGNSKSERASTPCTQRQRDGDDAERAVDFRGLTCGLGMELPGSVGQEAARLSYELQARLRVAAFQGGTGSGRQQSYGADAPTAGQEEGSEAGGAWVESVSYIECPDGEAVYNLEVEGTPNYFVGDHWLVHNCNAYKTTTTKRWKTLAKLITPQTWLWMMTGTPASQSPMDAFGLARMICPERVPKFASAWRDKVMYPVTRFKWNARPNARDEIFKALQPAIRFTKAECLDLPEVTYQTREVPLTAQVTKFYKALKNQLLVEAAGEQISAVNAASALSKLLQISGGAVYTDTREVVEFDVSPRLKELSEVLAETEHKVVVFVPFRHTIEVVSKYLTEEGVTNEVINGDVPARERSEIIKRFQTEKAPRVLVIQPQSASHGVTLTAADTIVFWSPVMSVETYMQCIGRIDRVGQVNKMTVVHLQGSECERRVYAMLQGKVDSHLKVVDLYKQELAS
jgi:superfamily II DNA or RNA helicase